MITKTKPRKPAKADKPRGASKPETLPASFKDIGHAVRENFERKAAALYERWKKGDVDLQSSEVDLLKKVPTETLSRHELERAMGLFERYGRKEKPKGPSPKIPAAIAEEIHHTFCPRGVAEKAGTAIAVRPAAVTVEVVDDLSADERKALARCESEFERSGRKALEGFVAMGRALREIRDSRLYRRTHSTFEAYLADRCGLRKTSGYELIDGATAYELAQPIAAKLNMRFTAAAQLRPLAKVESKTEMQDVLRRAAKKIEPDRHGDKVPTMAGLEEAVRDSTATVDYTPEQLRKDAQQRRWEETDRQRQAKAAESLGAHLEQDEPSPGMFARGPESIATGRLQVHEEALAQSLATIGDSDFWHRVLSGPIPIDGSDPDAWNHKQTGYARILHGINTIVRTAWAQHLGQGDDVKAFRKDLAHLMLQLELDIESDADPAGGTAGGKSKGGCLLDGREWKEMPAAARGRRAK